MTARVAAGSFAVADDGDAQAAAGIFLRADDGDGGVR
jgi:hypothetical protein